MDKNKSHKPDWAPENAGDEFAVKIIKGVGAAAPRKQSNVSREIHTADELVKGVVDGNRTILAKTITLVESNSRKHFEQAQDVLHKLLPYSGNSIRVGISGVPGAGKSTFIEALGMSLIKKGHKVAVLTVDPSSSLTKGSILGDKTRMENLSKEPNCFIRPSPTSGTLGGVTRKSRETIIVCEAAGYDIILIETVGVGQSEITVRSMVDFFLLVMISGAGDELQGIKKGVIEIADALVVNKADGENEQKANLARSEYANALHYLKPVTEGWKIQAFTCSALTGKGIEEIWKVVEKFVDVTKKSGVFEKRKKGQKIEWVLKMIEEELKAGFYNDKTIKKELPAINKDISDGKILPTAAAQKLLDLYNKSS
jgi:LAO/AO transport system kinase